MAVLGPSDLAGDKPKARKDVVIAKERERHLMSVDDSQSRCRGRIDRQILVYPTNAPILGPPDAVDRGLVFPLFCKLLRLPFLLWNLLYFKHPLNLNSKLPPSTQEMVP